MFFFFANFVGVQLKESFQHYKIKGCKKKKIDIPYTIHRDQVKVKTNKTLKNMTLLDKLTIGYNDNRFKIVKGNIWLSTQKNRRTQKHLNPKTFIIRRRKQGLWKKHKPLVDGYLS